MPENNNFNQHLSPQQIKVPVYKNLWLWAVVVLVLIIITMSIFILKSKIPFNNGSAKVNTTNIPVSQQQPLQKQASLGQQDLDYIDAGWTLLGQQPLVFNNGSYVSVVMGQGSIYNGAGLINVAVRVDIFENKNNQWYEVWHIPSNIESPCFIDNKNNADNEASGQLIRDFIVLQDSKESLVVANIPTVMGSAHGDSEVVAITVDNTGNCNLQAMDASGIMTVKKIDNQHIEVTGEGAYGTHEMYLQNGEFQQNIIPLSQMAPSQAVQAKFIVGSDGTVYPANTADVTLHVGQTIAFIPGNDQAKELFNSGKIDIYTNTFTTSGPSPSPPPIVLCEAFRMKEGNSATFDKTGDYEFILIPDNQVIQYQQQQTVPQATFTVMVQP
jgi:plastocyanin